MKQQDAYKEVKTFTYPNITVNVFIPDLTQEERSRRMKAIHKAAAELLIDRQRKKGEMKCKVM